jgi:hypothetical protein
MRRPWPSDQVAIDDQHSSSPRQKTRASAGVRVWLGFTGAHLGLLGDDLAVVGS